MEDSKLVYEIKDEFDPKSIIDTPSVLSNQLYLKESGEGYSLVTFKLSELAQPIYNDAEEAFHKKDYTKAIELYNKVIQVQPNYYHAFTLIGDAYFSSEKYDSAIVYFKKAINNNFADYNAHWFLADTYNKCYIVDSALKEITIAHLLNVNHENLNKALRYYRNKNNRPWKEWSYVPQYTLSKDGNKVTINTTADWLGYALVKSVWKYEPGYAESMIGKTGIAYTVLRPSGKVMIEDQLFDAFSRGDFVEKGETIIVIEREGITLKVKRANA